jgi:hypothetical protein
MVKPVRHVLFGLLVALSIQPTNGNELSYPIVDTLQTQCFDNDNIMIECPEAEQAYFGQDAQYVGLQPQYQVNADGSVTDINTQLVWNPSIDTNGDGQINIDDKLSYHDALAFAKASRFAGLSDWRVPSIKELYSLIHFDGQDPSGLNKAGTYQIVPFIDHNYFSFSAGDTESGERIIDGQYVSATKYVSTTMPSQDDTVFGVNFIDGRIKGYGTNPPHGEKRFFVLLVRGNTEYGLNKLVDLNNATILDQATGLVWQKNDSQKALDWPASLSYCENLTLAGNSEWRLPNLKELESIVDYTRSPSTTRSAAIDPLFSATLIENEAGQPDYANYWSSTTHVGYRKGHEGSNGAYISFGRSMGYMGNQWIDVHGAGSQRSDPKVGDATAFPRGHGPQGDAIRINNLVRCVSGGATQNIHPSYVAREPVSITLSGNEPSANSAPFGKRSMPSQSNSGKANPPRLAIEACHDRRLNQECAIQAPNKTIAGQCLNVRSSLTCVPSPR